MFGPSQPHPSQKTFLAEPQQSMFTSTTLTHSDVEVDYDSIVLESFKESITIQDIAHGHIAPALKLTNLSTKFYPHLFFAVQTQLFLGEEIFADKELRDFMYSLLARLKYNCRSGGGQIADIVEFIAATGADAESLAEHTATAKLTDAQELFNNAYVTTVEQRYALLECYEWGIIAFLCNMYFVQIYAIMREFTANEKS